MADNGKGIPPRILSHLFDGLLSFDTADISDSTRFMGIGLAVCKTIIEAHGGTISARNSAHGGAEFFFTLKKSGKTDYEYT